MVFDMRIKLENLQIVKSAEIVVDGITVVTGANDSGKTSLIRGVRALATGQGGGDLIRVGSKLARVTIEDGEDTYVWERTAKSFAYVINGERHTRVGKRSLQEVAPDSPISWEVISAGSRKQTVWPQLSDQQRQPFPFNLDKSVVAKLLSRFLGAGALEEIVLELRDRRKASNRDLDRAGGAVDQVSIQLSRLGTALERFPSVGMLSEAVSQAHARTEHSGRIDSVIELSESAMAKLSKIEKVILTVFYPVGPKGSGEAGINTTNNKKTKNKNSMKSKSKFETSNNWPSSPRKPRGVSLSPPSLKEELIRDGLLNNYARARLDEIRTLGQTVGRDAARAAQLVRGLAGRSSHLTTALEAQEAVVRLRRCRHVAEDTQAGPMRSELRARVSRQAGQVRGLSDALTRVKAYRTSISDLDDRRKWLVATCNELRAGLAEFSVCPACGSQIKPETGHGCQDT